MIVAQFIALQAEILTALGQQVDPAYRELVQNRYNMDVSTFLGVRTPTIHKIANRYYKNLKLLPIAERLAAASFLLDTGIYELKITAFRWGYLSRNDLTAEHFSLLAGWLAQYVDDWIDCDDLCIHVLGEFFLRHPGLAAEVRAWTRADNRWVRRGAAVAIILPARKGQQLALALEIADLLMQDGDDLVQKGYGWLLKEASKQHPQAVFDYVMARREQMPRTAFRYALEKLPTELRQAAMKG